MLVNFSVQNFKSYRKETKLNMEKAPRIRDLSYSLLCESIKSKHYQILCSSVLYGPNASGKSNIMDALLTLKNIVLNGNLRNNINYNLELIPFIFSQ